MLVSKHGQRAMDRDEAVDRLAGLSAENGTEFR